MSVKITLEFKGVDEAIVALAKLTAVKAAAVTPPVQLLLAAPEATPPTLEQRIAEAPRKTRKPRSDAGKERGPYKTTGEPAASEPAAQAVNSVAVSAAAPATPTIPAAPVETPVKRADTDPAPLPPAAAGPVSDEEVQKAVEKIFGAKGYDDTLALLSRFGVKRGKDLRQDMRADFLKRVDAVIAGEAI